MRQLCPDKCIRTVSGQHIHVLNPQPETILIEDIAWALSGEQRFGNHMKVPFYCVAQHSVRVALMVTPEPALQLQALMHDAGEFVFRDLGSPIKNELPEYRTLIDRLDAVCAKKFGYQFPFDKEVKTADNTLLEVEFDDLMVGEGLMVCWDRQCAYNEFLRHFHLFSNNMRIADHSPARRS